MQPISHTWGMPLAYSHRGKRIKKVGFLLNKCTKTCHEFHVNKTSGEYVALLKKAESEKLKYLNNRAPYYLENLLISTVQNKCS
jgi:hypothetical protein